jgi:cytochrome c peroxidase
MRYLTWIRLLFALLSVMGSLALVGRGGTEPRPELSFRRQSGTVETVSTRGPIDFSALFFQDLGTNGRACATCHVASDGWGLSPSTVQSMFERTRGMHPLFRTNDGSTSPDANVSTLEARRTAYALLLSRGLIRVGIAPPANAEFVVEAVDDPYGVADVTRLSLFRRPLPTANLAFLSGVMWDGRETFDGQAVHFDLARQANGATLDHAQAAEALTAEEQAAIVDFELSLFTAQVYDNDAGHLAAPDAGGGARPLIDQPFFLGINAGPNASRRVFTLFDAWASTTPPATLAEEARQAVVIGQDIFNNLTFGEPQLTCSTCHNAPNVGSNSRGDFFSHQIGIGAIRPRDPALPLYTLRCLTTNSVVRTTDPGRALITGRCSDIGRFKVPMLRGLAAHAPYFHDGSAATLRDVVLFYDDLFKIGLRGAQIDALVAFLRAL